MHQDVHTALMNSPGWRGDIERSYVETYGKRTFDAPGGDFVLSGQADRIDIRNDGKAAILDYKTGATPTRRPTFSSAPRT